MPACRRPRSRSADRSTTSRRKRARCATRSRPTSAATAPGSCGRPWRCARPSRSAVARMTPDLIRGMCGRRSFPDIALRAHPGYDYDTAPATTTTPLQQTHAIDSAKAIFKMQKHSATACLAALLGLIATQGAAQEIVSQYTSADTRKCRKVERVKVDDTEYAAVWACKGLADYVVAVSEEDLRTTVSVGRNVKAAAREPAASQGFGPFNFTYETVEWRGVKGTPFAIIQRWNISDNENPGKDGRPGRT